MKRQYLMLLTLTAMIAQGCFFSPGVNDDCLEIDWEIDADFVALFALDDQCVVENGMCAVAIHSPPFWVDNCPTELDVNALLETYIDDANSPIPFGQSFMFAVLDQKQTMTRQEANPATCVYRVTTQCRPNM